MSKKKPFPPTIPTSPAPECDERPTVMPKAFNMQGYSSPMMEAFREYDTDERAMLDKLCGRTENEFEWIGRFVLPPFQRPAVWSSDQKVRFVESIWLGYEIGRYVIYQPHNPTYSRFTDALIDGQQRIRTILEYVAGGFPVFGYRYTELPLIDRRAFDFGTIFPKSEIKHTLSEAELRDIYNRLNYGGTPHTEDQRA